MIYNDKVATSALMKLILDFVHTFFAVILSNTVQNIKSKLMDSGLDSALSHAKQVRKPTNPIITEEIEEKL